LNLAFEDLMMISAAKFPARDSWQSCSLYRKLNESITETLTICLWWISEPLIADWIRIGNTLESMVGSFLSMFKVVTQVFCPLNVYKLQHCLRLDDCIYWQLLFSKK